ncbi:MAG: type II/IV secretion system protein [Sedimentisphaerales bacterium]|nr:type II/IV secretion system protein [Sedimentisphaerales bacterium]
MLEAVLALERVGSTGGVEGYPAVLLVSLSFNPIRLLLLVAWFYLCVYLVQRVNFSPLVPKDYRVYANVLTLFTGPVLLVTLFLIDTAKKTREGKESFFEVLTRQLQHVVTALRSVRSQPEEEDTVLHLLDSSGRTLDDIYGHGEAKREDAKFLNLTEETIANALERRASDLLIDPRDEATYTIRLRVDGVLRTVNELNADACRAIINSIKAVSGMDISERRRPQDGGFMARRGSSTASFRVASAGVLNGEKLSIRVLNKNAGSFTLADVGFSGKQHEILQEALKKPSGMILICGPTGSGKTTTMYAMLNEVDRFTRNVITVEDPIEAVLPESSQIEINPKADITFAKALRSILRQDPDVICVGEIRDEETAEIALRAAQTGHLVLATIHCDSNATALIRLLDLRVSPLLLSAGLNLIVSQRLVRVLCKRCKRPAQLSDSQIDGFHKKGIDHSGVFEPGACRYCEKTGYYGRIAVCDLMVVNDALKAEIAQGESLIAKLRTEGTQKGLAGLRKEGLKKIVAGVTSLAELKRVVG